MANTLIPSIQFFAQEIFQELNADLNTQSTKIAERIINFSPQKISELHLQDWYSTYWKLVGLSHNMKLPAEQTKFACNKIMEFANREVNPVRKQYCALALLLFGKVQEFQRLANVNLWSKNLRDDFNKFANFYNLTVHSENLGLRAQVRRNFKIKDWLQNKYDYLIQKYANFVVNDTNCPKVESKDYKIWYCWLQGEDKLPPLIQCCYESLKMNAGNYKICFINEENISDYITLPKHIIEKFRGGGITKIHFSDILRANLLYNYGGLWIDSTILVTEPLEKYKHILESFYHTEKRHEQKINNIWHSTFISYGRWAGYRQGTNIKHHPLFAFMKDLFFDYWKEFDSLIDYFLIDYAIDLAYDNIPFVKQNIDNVKIKTGPMLHMDEHWNLPYKQHPYEEFFKSDFMFKLNRRAEIDFNKPGTVFREIQRRYAPTTIGRF